MQLIKNGDMFHPLRMPFYYKQNRAKNLGNEKYSRILTMKTWKMAILKSQIGYLIGNLNYRRIQDI